MFSDLNSKRQPTIRSRFICISGKTEVTVALPDLERGTNSKGPSLISAFKHRRHQVLLLDNLGELDQNGIDCTIRDREPVHASSQWLLLGCAIGETSIWNAKSCFALSSVE